MLNDELQVGDGKYYNRLVHSSFILLSADWYIASVNHTNIN